MPAPRKSSTKPANRRSRGFLQTGGLLTKEIREASSQRGFSQTRLLTQWAEIVGASVAKICQPVRVSYAKNGFGATLTLLTNGANAPMLQMQLPQIRERVNASYGYNAISRITITQTAPSGFGEPVQQEFERRKSAPNPETLSRIQGGISDVKDDRLKDALLKLGENIAARNSSKKQDITMNRKEFLLSLGASTVALGTNAQFALAQDKPMVEEMVMGSEDAPVTLIEYASYTCPHCKTFHETTWPQLKENFIDTGKVKFIFREVYFDRLGLWAGMLARCGGAEKYFGVSDLLFKRQSEWTRGESGAEIAENLYTIGRVAGMDNETMEACLQNREHAEALVAEFQKNSEADGVNATPTLVLNGVNIGNKSYSELATMIEEAAS